MGEHAQVLAVGLGVVERFNKETFLHTNKGGRRYDAISRLMPISQLFQRHISWMSGLADKFLDTPEDDESDDDNNDDDEELDEIVHET